MCVCVVVCVCDYMYVCIYIYIRILTNIHCTICDLLILSNNGLHRTESASALQFTD